MTKWKLIFISAALVLIIALVTLAAFVFQPRLPGSLSDSQLMARDLSQQTLMAWGTWGIFVVSGLGLAFSGVGIYLLARTLSATKDTADAAQASANAAAAALKQDRAWMTPVGLIEVRERYGKTLFIFGWDNTGRTPALNVQIGYDFRLVEGAIPAGVNVDAQLALEDQFVVGKNGRGEGVVGPGNRVSTAVPLNTSMVNERMCVDSTGMRCTVIINLSVRYKSIYEGAHESMTTFMMEFFCGQGLFANPSKYENLIISNIELRPVGLQNYAT